MTITATQQLTDAARALRELNPALSPVAMADARENAIVAGLHGLAGHFGREIDFTYIDANGELKFNTKHAQRYGEDLAGILNLIPVRCGVQPSQGHVLPEGTWCRINHFDAERLVKVAAKIVAAPAPIHPSQGPTP